jgi:hypothetical protein
MTWLAFVRCSLTAAARRRLEVLDEDMERFVDWIDALITM